MVIVEMMQYREGRFRKTYGRGAGMTIDLLFRRPFTFFRIPVVKRDLPQGAAGEILSINHPSHTLARYAKLRLGVK